MSKYDVQHVFIDLKDHFLKMSHLMFCKACGAFINPSKGKCERKKDLSKDFQHGQRTDDGLAAIQFGPLFTVSTIIIKSTHHDYHQCDYDICQSDRNICLCVLGMCPDDIFHIVRSERVSLCYYVPL